ncbi:unnamed protein product [Blepharisma stoltei]|uniref:Uncharacterized protein n=1 Tax=Blepharisma stoltei TaxID=1481888 RepID=A0AAU9KK30_9CILI|nr:unnamed protein product [Blepharisma stoltei]
MISISREKLLKPGELLKLHTTFRNSLVSIDTQTSNLQAKIKNQNDIIAHKKQKGDQKGTSFCIKLKKFYERKMLNLEDKRNKIEGFLYVMECISLGKFTENKGGEVDTFERLKTESEQCDEWIRKITLEIGEPYGHLENIDEDELLDEIGGVEEQEMKEYTSSDEEESKIFLFK